MVPTFAVAFKTTEPDPHLWPLLIEVITGTVFTVICLTPEAQAAVPPKGVTKQA